MCCNCDASQIRSAVLAANQNKGQFACGFARKGIFVDSGSNTVFPGRFTEIGAIPELGGGGGLRKHSEFTKIL